MSNELAAEMHELHGSIKTLEEEALNHEQAARECRAKRAAQKLRLAELQAVIENSKVMHAVNGSLAIAQAAQAAAEQSKAQASVVLESLKAKQAELDALLAKLSPPEQDLK